MAFSKENLKYLQDIIKHYEKLEKRDLQELGDIVVDEMKDLIRKGISPIQGKGRFAAYKAAGVVSSQGKRKRTGYPFSVQREYPSKKPRPVNLFLSGEFLDDLESKVKAKNSIEVGYFTQESSEKESGHREGVNGQPKRPTIPQGNERFSNVIINEVLEKAVELITKRVQSKIR